MTPLSRPRKYGCGFGDFFFRTPLKMDVNLLSWRAVAKSTTAVTGSYMKTSKFKMMSGT